MSGSRGALVLGVLVGLVCGLALPDVRATQYRLETQTDRDLLTVLNQHAANLDELKADFNLLHADFALAKALIGNDSVGAAGLAEGTNANTLKTQAAVWVRVGGVNYIKAITDNIAMTAATAQADLTYRLYLVSSGVTGTITVTAGTAVATDTAVLPALPASNAAIGYFKVATSGGTFTSGTTDLSAAGVTATYVDLGIPNSGTSAPTAAATTIAAAAAHTVRQ